MRFKMDDGTIVDTAKAQTEWEERTQWNGSNHISVNTGSQWEHETLYCSAKGRYYLVHTSAYQGKTPWAEWVDGAAAASWLLYNNQPLPEELIEVAQKLCE